MASEENGDQSRNGSRVGGGRLRPLPANSRTPAEEATVNVPKRRTLVLATAAIVAALGVVGVRAQQPGFTRVELQRGDLSVPGREVVTVRAEFTPGGAVGRHTHPGEESSYVLEGTLLLEVDGKPPVVVKAGEVFFIPAGVVHAAKNDGVVPLRVVTNYVVEKGKPLATPAK
jgi:quercetin dioxygenase-like cupin family protein